MLFSILQTTAVGMFLAVSVTGTPSSSDPLDIRSIRLDNGEESVDAIIYAGPPKEARSMADDGSALMARQSSIDCKGSAFCERLGGSCDDAFRKVIATNEYSTFQGSQNSGTCSGTCGLFFSGDHCQGTGQELIDAYNAIRDKGHCTHCGRFKRDSDGCMIKIDRVTGC
ncbi:hypothetical protein PG994_004305 [Apiospora phragmitis]|uniref:Uncharacterized protein n=1 Tax=Apiospora phragmitis TaxID=2905665 RepID=A0ABR1VQ83_9PEZI